MTKPKASLYNSIPSAETEVSADMILARNRSLIWSTGNPSDPGTRPRGSSGIVIFSIGKEENESRFCSGRDDVAINAERAGLTPLSTISMT